MVDTRQAPPEPEPEPAPRVQPMSGVDTAWLRMDNEVNLMMIVGVWLLTPAISLQALRDRLQCKLLQHERFGQRVVSDATGVHWQVDAHFDIRHHVVPVILHALPGESPKRSLQRLCAELAVTPLDPQRPLWQFHLHQGYEGGSALIARVHHCIGDGIALMSVMMSITDGGASPPQRSQRGLGAETLAHPQPSLMDGLDMARSGLRAVNDVAALAFMADDSPTLLKGRHAGDLSGRKVVAWSEPMSLADVKTLGKGLGCTVNDVLLACVAGAIGGHLRSRAQDPAGKEIRAMVPVNLRSPDEAWQLGNHFGLAPLLMPVGIQNPVERVFAVRRRMDELKGSYQPLLAFGVLSATGLFAKPVQDVVLGLFANKTTAVMSNVPGPAVPLKFCGSTLRQALFWVPTSGHVGVGLSILSYGGGVQFGLITDHKLCPEPQDIVDRFEPEFEKLMCLSLMLPWPGQDF